MIGLFESLARQALGLRPEIVPLEPRSSTPQATVASLEFLPAAGDISWAELHPAVQQAAPSHRVAPKSIDTSWAAGLDHGRQPASPDRGPSPDISPDISPDTTELFAHFAEELDSRATPLDGIHTPRPQESESTQSGGDITRPALQAGQYPEPHRDFYSVKSEQVRSPDVHPVEGSRVDFPIDQAPQPEERPLACAAASPSTPAVNTTVLQNLLQTVPQTAPAIGRTTPVDGLLPDLANKARRSEASVPKSWGGVDRTSAAGREEESRVRVSDNSIQRPNQIPSARSTISPVIPAATTSLPAIDLAPHSNTSPFDTANRAGDSVAQGREDVERLSAAARAENHAGSSMGAVVPVAVAPLSPWYTSTTHGRAVQQDGSEVFARPESIAKPPAQPEQTTQLVGAPQRAVSTVSDAEAPGLESRTIPESSSPIGSVDGRQRSSTWETIASVSQTVQSPAETIYDTVAVRRADSDFKGRSGDQPAVSPIVSPLTREKAKPAELAEQIERRTSQRQMVAAHPAASTAVTARLEHDLSISAQHPQTHRTPDHPDDWSRNDPSTSPFLNTSPQSGPSPTGSEEISAGPSQGEASANKTEPTAPSAIDRAIDPAIDPAIARQRDLHAASQARTTQLTAIPRSRLREAESAIGTAKAKADHFLRQEHASNVPLYLRNYAQSPLASAASHNQQPPEGPTASVVPNSAMGLIARPVPDAPPAMSSHPSIPGRQADMSRPAMTSDRAAVISRKRAPSRSAHRPDADETRLEHQTAPMAIPPTPSVFDFVAASAGRSRTALQNGTQKESGRSEAPRTLPRAAPASSPPIESPGLFAAKHAATNSRIPGSTRVPKTASGTGKAKQATVTEDHEKDRLAVAPLKYRAADVEPSGAALPTPIASVYRPAPDGGSQPREGLRSTSGNPHGPETANTAQLVESAVLAQKKRAKRADMAEHREGLAAVDRSGQPPGRPQAKGWRPKSEGVSDEIANSQHGQSLSAVGVQTKTNYIEPLSSPGSFPSPSAAAATQRANKKLTVTSFFQAKSSSTPFPTGRRTLPDGTPPPPLRISIGRIAIETPLIRPKRSSGRPKPQLSLGQYLGRREGGR